MKKAEAQQILAALDGIKAAYNAVIPAFSAAQKKFAPQLNSLVKQFNSTSGAISQSFNVIRPICAEYANDPAPVITEFTITKDEVAATFDYATELRITEAPDNAVQFTVTGPGGTANATAKVAGA